VARNVPNLGKQPVEAVPYTIFPAAMSVWGAPTPHLDYLFPFLPIGVDLTSKKKKNQKNHTTKKPTTHKNNTTHFETLRRENGKLLNLIWSAILWITWPCNSFPGKQTGWHFWSTSCSQSFKT